MNKQRKFLFLILIIYFIVNVSCATTYKRNNLNTTDKYLQRKSFNIKLADDYGYVESNPIILKLSDKLGNDLIIEEYIKRLWKNGKGSSYGTLQSFEIIEKSKIIAKYNQIEKSKNEYSKWIFSYTIRSTDKTEIIKLFFKLKRHTNELYSPKGFGYSLICGE